MELQEKKDKLIKFIKDNEIEFYPGNRNTPAVIIAGFSKYLGFKHWEDVLELFEVEESGLLDNDQNSLDELERVLEWVYEEATTDYEIWWTKPGAKAQFKF